MGQTRDRKLRLSARQPSTQIGSSYSALALMINRAFLGKVREMASLPSWHSVPLLLQRDAVPS